MKEKLMEWMSVLGMEASAGVAFVVMLFVTVFVILLSGVLLNFGIKKLLGVAQKTRTLWDDALLRSVKAPLTLLVWSVGLTYAVELLWLDLGEEVDALVANVRDLMVIVSVAWFAIRFLRHAEENIFAEKHSKVPIDVVGLRALNKILKASVVITAGLVALNTMGYSIAGVLAFGGIGGIAVGFAARDLLANFFGGLMLYLDRPFTEGENIRSPDRTIEGEVEHIGWRLTRVRTFERRLLYVPNATFASIAVENMTRMTHRRIREIIGVRYDDVAKVPKIAQEIEDMLTGSGKIDNDQSVVVRLSSFSDSSVDIFVNVYTRTTGWSEFHKVKQELMMQIHDIVENNGAEIAFPTTTVHIESPPKT